MSGPGAAPSAISVVVAEDQALLRASLAALVGAEADLTVVGVAADGREAVETVRRTRPDVVLMDLRMPVLDGVGATRLIAGDPALADTRVLVLTMVEEAQDVLAALRAGASGFLLKDTEPQALVDGVRTVRAGQSLLSPRVLERLVVWGVGGVTGGERAGLVGVVGALTPRQREVLGLIARGRSNAEIEVELGITRATCRTHITALLARLGARDRAQLVIAAYESGLLAGGPGGPGGQAAAR